MPPQTEEARWDENARPQDRPEARSARWEAASQRRLQNVSKTGEDSRGLGGATNSAGNRALATEVACHRSFRLKLDAGSIPAASTILAALRPPGSVGERSAWPFRAGDRGQGAGHSGQNAWEREQNANVPLQFKQQTGVVPRQPHAPPAACAGELRSCAEPIANASTTSAIVTSLFIADLLCGFG